MATERLQANSGGASILVAGLSEDFYLSLRSMAGQLPDFGWLGRACTLAEAVEVTQSRPLDVVLFPIPLGGPWERPLVRSLLNGNGPPSLLALCETETQDLQYEALFLGASALTSWNTPMEYVISTIRRICQGEAPIDYAFAANLGLVAQVRRRLRDWPDYMPIDDAECPLSEREREILLGASRGLTNKEIGHQMGLSHQTVKNYVSALLKKLGAHDRAHAVVLALRQGWMTPP